MKLILISFIIWGISTAAHAQLTNTKWSGKMAVPQITEVTLEFSKDTVNVVLANTGDILETMAYSIKDNIVTLKKLSGGSPCEIGSAFTIKYAVTGSELMIKVENDPCEHRAQAWTGEPFKKIN